MTRNKQWSSTTDVENTKDIWNVSDTIWLQEFFMCFCPLLKHTVYFSKLNETIYTCALITSLLWLYTFALTFSHFRWNFYLSVLCLALAFMYVSCVHHVCHNYTSSCTRYNRVLSYVIKTLRITHWSHTLLSYVYTSLTDALPHSTIICVHKHIYTYSTHVAAKRTLCTRTYRTFEYVDTD